MAYGFQERLKFSQGVRMETDTETIKSMLPGCVSVEKASADLDKRGVDYIATLRGGAEVYIDAKTRQGKMWSRHFDRNDPEVAIEKWSVCPGGKYNIPEERAKTGWTLDESKITDMILYTWDEATDKAYLVPFQTLRTAARLYWCRWERIYKLYRQESHKQGRQWESEAMFIPVSMVLKAMNDVMQGEVYSAQRDTENSTAPATETAYFPEFQTNPYYNY